MKTITRKTTAIWFLAALGCIAFAPASWAQRSSTPPPDTSSVARIPRSEIVAVSKEIDRLVQQKLASEGLSRNPQTTDEQFVRRVYLDIVGRIPTLEETKAFLDSNDSDKRAALIDRLLDSYGHVSRQFNFWADLLRVQSRTRNQIGTPYIDWIKDSLQENKPYDQFVREMLTAEGPMMDRENGAVGYYLRDFNMPEDNMSNTVRIFLGTRLECAQCHDHPFDKWTQRQYYEMVAFTGGMQYRLREPDSEYAEQFRGLRRSRDFDDRTRAVLRRFIEPLTTGISGSGTGLARLPEDFMGDDGEPLEIVLAKTMFEGESLVDPAPVNERMARRRPRNRNANDQLIFGARPVGSRQAYAEWLTSPENPRFSMVMANRLWKQAMGLGLVEPVDVFDDGTSPSNPELMDYLARTFVDLGFDMKQMLRAIYNSQTYQAQASTSDIENPKKYAFPGPVVRRMSAEQMWDSLLTLAVPDVDRRVTGQIDNRLARAFGGDDVYAAYERLRSMPPDELVDLAEQIANGGMRRDANRMNAVRDQLRNASAELKRQARELANQMRRARRQGDDQRIQELNRKRLQLMQELMRNRPGQTGLVRASELPSPAPAGHFLREFGQSDRETIENANTEPSVPQALSLMNGIIEKEIVQNPNTVLMLNVARAGEDEKLDAVWLTLLSRKPTRAERRIWEQDLQHYPPKEVLGDLIWTLVNSDEFMFVH